MKLYELVENVDIQTEYTVVYYDEEREERVEITDVSEVSDNEINYIYAENGIIYIEIEYDRSSNEVSA